MEGFSHFSEKKHSDFIDRFKGKINMVNKTGHLGVVASTGKPIEKSVHAYSDVYRSIGSFTPYLSTDQSSIVSTLPSSRMSNAYGSDAVLGTRPKYYTPMGSVSGFKRDIESFSVACDFFGLPPQRKYTLQSVPSPPMQQYAGINPLYQATVHEIPNEYAKKMAIMSMKETPRYPSQGKGYYSACYNGSLTEPSSTTASRQKKLSVYANPMYSKSVLENPGQNRHLHYNYAKAGSYIVGPKEKNLPLQAYKYKYK